MDRKQLLGAGLFAALTMGADHMAAQCAPALLTTLAATRSQSSIEIDGNYAYVAHGGSPGALDIIDISNPAAPSLVSSLSMMGSETARGLDVVGDYVYVATNAWLRVIDVSNPAAPAIVGSHNTTLNGADVYDVAVDDTGSTAYLAGFGVECIDVSTKTAPAFLGKVESLGNRVHLSGTIAYVGQSSPSTGYVYLVDVSDPTTPAVLGTAGYWQSWGIAVVSGTTMYMHGGGSGLTTWDVSDPTSPVLGTVIAVGLMTDFVLDEANDRLYAVHGFSNGFSVVDISDRPNPAVIGTLARSISPDAVAAFGAYAYSVDQNELFVVDVLSCAPPPEYAPTDYAVGANPCDVLAKELTGDNRPDIATADSGADTVTVLTNDGSGGFGGTPTTIALAAGSAPAALAGGELVAGGGCDIAVAAMGGDAVIILDNDPVGTFTVVSTLSTLPATEPIDIAAGDINGSGTDDMVVAMQGDVLLPGTGNVAISIDGAALVSLTAPVGGFIRPQSIALCDLDGDGDNDIAVTMMGDGFSATVTDNILLYENVGGSFGAPIALSVAQNPRGITCGDFDDDGDNDLAVTAESSPFLLPGTVEVFDNVSLAPTTWSPSDFVSGGSFTGGSLPSAIAHADLRDDSIPGFCALHDLVAVNFGSENLTRFDEYDGTTDSFTAQEDMTAGAVPAALAIANFNKDKTPDIVVANKGGNSVTVLTVQNVALAKTFGAGCPGTGGLVPQIAAIGKPTYGNVFGIQLSDTRPFAPTIFALSLSQSTSAFGPCNFYLGNPVITLLTLTNASGQGVVGLGLPAAGPYDGCDVFFQFASFDTNGAFADQFAFSNALRTKLGN